MNQRMISLILIVACVAVVSVRANYGHHHHHQQQQHYHHHQPQQYHCTPKVSIKYHTVPIYVPYTVIEKYPIYKYEQYPVKVPVYVKVKDEYHEPHGYHQYDGHHNEGHYAGNHYEGQHYGAQHDGHYFENDPTKKAAKAAKAA